MMIRDEHVVGERISLRPLTPEAGRGAYLAWMNDPDVMRNLEAPKREYTAEDLVEYIESRNASKNELMFGIFLNDGDQHVGNIKIILIPAHERGSIGIIIGEKSLWGQGYATEAISLFSDYLFSKLNLMKITASCHESNIGSEKAFVNSGYAIECRRPKHHLVEGRWEEGVFMGLINPSRAGE